jgi:hypothetical protein
MSTLHRLHYWLTALRCLRWQPPDGITRSVFLIPESDSLFVGLVHRSGVAVEMEIDPTASRGHLHAALDEAAGLLEAEVRRQRAGVEESEPELVRD